MLNLLLDKVILYPRESKNRPVCTKEGQITQLPFVYDKFQKLITRIQHGEIIRVQLGRDSGVERRGFAICHLQCLNCSQSHAL